jgi:integrase
MSVRKREWTTSKGEQREAWLVDYRDSNGVRAFSTFERKKDADAFWATVQVDVGKGDLVAPSKAETVKEAAERWIRRVEADGAEPTTIRQYRQHIDLHIAPKIGTIKVALLTESRMETFRDELLQKLSRPLARKVLVSAKSILRTAKRGHIAANVKIKTDKRKKKLELGADIPTPAEIQRLLKAADSAEGRVGTLIELGTTRPATRRSRWQRWPSEVAARHTHRGFRPAAAVYAEGVETCLSQGRRQSCVSEG